MENAIIELKGRIDSTNAADWEPILLQAAENANDCELLLNAEELEYISSAGLRILLKLAKKKETTKIVEVRPEVYDIFLTTGFNEILHVEKALRKVAVDGCALVGRGAHGEVFQIAPDTLVKVYLPGFSIDRIRREIAYARKAFVMGIPTAIPFDIVRVGERYGAVFELLSAIPICDYIRGNEERTQIFIHESVSMLKHLHSQTVAAGELPSMKANTIRWLQEMRDIAEPYLFERLMDFVSGLPDSMTLLHGDVNPGNFMFSDGNLMLIDMDTLSTGDPIFELATLFVTYRQFPKINKKAAEMFGLTLQKAAKMWDSMLREYTECGDERQLAEVERKAQLLGCIRVIHYMRQHTEIEDRTEAIRICIEDIETIVLSLVDRKTT